MELLAEYHRWYKEEKFRWGDKWEDNDYLFPRENGAPMFPGYVCNWLATFSKRHGLGTYQRLCGGCDFETGEGETEGSGRLRTVVTEKWMRSHSSTHPLSFYQYCFTCSLDSFSDN